MPCQEFFENRLSVFLDLFSVFLYNVCHNADAKKEVPQQMNQNLTAEISHSIQEFRFPKYEEIPDVGLFLEQVTKYVSGFLEPLGDTITITSSMISNYVK